MAFEVDTPQPILLDKQAILRKVEETRDRMLSESKLLRELAYLRGLPGLSPAQQQAFDDAHKSGVQVVALLAETYVKASAELIVLQSS